MTSFGVIHFTFRSFVVRSEKRKENNDNDDNNSQIDFPNGEIFSFFCCYHYLRTIKEFCKAFSKYISESRTASETFKSTFLGASQAQESDEVFTAGGGDVGISNFFVAITRALGKNRKKIAIPDDLTHQSKANLRVCQ